MANEKRLIDANALDALEDLDYDYAPVRDGCAWYRAADVWACIESQPTVDAVEVVHGRWIPQKYEEKFEVGNYEHAEYVLYHCSECGVPCAVERNFCSNCGAKMDGGKEDGC